MRVSAGVSFLGFNIKRGTFMWTSFGLLALFFAWQVLDWMEFLIRNPSSAIVHNNWIGMILYGVYFAVAYAVIFVKGWGKMPPADDTWPPARCYGLFLWTLLTVLSSPPLSGSARAYVMMCVAVDILFLVRMIIGRIRNECGWTWQTYAVIYVWMELLVPDLVI